MLEHGALWRRAEALVQVTKLLAVPGVKQLAACMMPAIAGNTTPRYMFSPVRSSGKPSLVHTV